MQAFHNDKEVQNKYITRVKDHAKADELIRGSYWEKRSDGVFRGCAVGCTIHGSSHKAYETELGIPEWIAKLEDRIFEGASIERAETWPVEFLETINIGSDLSKILIPMLIFIVESAREKTNHEKALKAIDGVLIELKKNDIDYVELKEARKAASCAATYAATYAAYAATYAATYAAYAAVYAAYAANAATAVTAAAYANAATYARENEYDKFANKLLELIRECK